MDERTIPGGHFTPRPHFIVLAIAQRAHDKAESETACRGNALKLVSPNQPDLQQLWGQSTPKPVRVEVRVRVRVRVLYTATITMACTQVVPPLTFSERSDKDTQLSIYG